MSSLLQAAKLLASHAADCQNGQQIAERLTAIDAARFGGEPMSDTDQLLAEFKAWQRKAPVKSDRNTQLPELY